MVPFDVKYTVFMRLKSGSLGFLNANELSERAMSSFEDAAAHRNPNRVF